MIQKRSLHAFLSNLFDYAGLFPPANLPLEKAVSNYARFLTNQDSWMLGRFIIPASRLNELEPHMHLFTESLPLSCAVLGRRSLNAKDCLEGLKADLESIQSFRKHYGSILEIGVLELPLPPVSLNSELIECIGMLSEKQGLVTFCEITYPLDSHWEHQLLETLNQIQEYNLKGRQKLGLKLRTGGVTSDAFPTPAQVSAALLGCGNRNIPMKFTAGLHHPVRMYRDEVGTRMHGFLNVFIAGMLAHEHDLDIHAITNIVTDEEATNFCFLDDHFTWKDYKLSVMAIEKLREVGLRSYGTCSFDDPREDLRNLEILYP
ncbi:MAG: hypothetical protein WD907_06835 [Bacilli bacterium]